MLSPAGTEHVADALTLPLEHGVDRKQEHVATLAEQHVDPSRHFGAQLRLRGIELHDEIESLVVERALGGGSRQGPDAGDMTGETEAWERFKENRCGLPHQDAVDVGFAHRSLDEHADDFRNGHESLAAGHAIPNPNLPARIRAEVLLVYDEPGTTSVDAAVVQLVFQQLDVSRRFLDTRSDVFTLRVFLGKLQRRALAVTRMRLFDEHLGSPAGEGQVLLGLLEIVGRLPQLFPGDEAFLQQGLQRPLLLLKACHFSFGELQAGACFVHADRSFSFRERVHRRLTLLSVDFRDLQVHLSLPPLLRGALQLSLNVCGVDACQQIAFVDPRPLVDEKRHLRVARKGRAVRDRLDRFQDATRRQLRSERPPSHDSRHRGVGPVPAPQGRAGKDEGDRRKEHHGADDAVAFQDVRECLNHVLRRRLTAR